MPSSDASSDAFSDASFDSGSAATVSPGSPLRVGWIGTGVMGRSMARHVLAAGHALVVHTRTRAKAETLLEAGATWAATPREAAEGRDVVVSIVGMPADVEAVHLGADGTLAAERAPRVLLDCTTSTPSLAERIAGAAATGGSGSVDAPVSGGDVGARDGTLVSMVGGHDEAVAAARPILECFSRSIVHQGGPGTGQHAKAVNQIVIAGTMMGAAEGLLYAERAGLDAERVLEAIGGGAAGSWTIVNLAPRMLRRDFEPGFSVEHFLKDLGIALDEADRLGAPLPAVALARQLYVALRGAGHGDRGTQAILLAYEALAGRSA